MALLPISLLLQPVTTDQVRAKFVSMLNTLGIPADKWRAGGVASSILTIVAMTYANFSQLIADGVASGFLGTAKGDWLTLLAQYVYNVQRPTASFASGPLTFTNEGGSIGTFAPGDFIVQNAVTKKTYQNTDLFSIVAGSFSSPSTVTVNFQAQTAGAAGTANPGDISVLITSMNGVSVTNLASLVGLDAMPDPVLVQLCQAKLGSLSPGGPSQAYQFAVTIAVNPITGLPVGVNRKSVQLDPTTGKVTVTVASPSGPVDPNDIAGIINAIVAIAVPDAVTFLVNSAVPVSYSPTITVYAQGLPGVDATQIAQAAATAITNYIDAYPIGGLKKGSGASKLWGSGVAGAIEDVNGAIFAVDMGTGADLTLLANQVAIDSVPQPTVILVPPP